MLFTSLSYILLFLPLVLMIYYLLSFSEVLQKIFLTIAGILFYTLGEPKGLLIFTGLTAFNSLTGLGIIKFDQKWAKIILILSVIINSAIFLALRYTSFLLDSANMIIHNQSASYTETLIPLGMAFYTLRAVAFNVDCYKNKVKTTNIIDILQFFTFFPFLIAGPLVSYDDLKKGKIEKRFSFRRFSVGISRLVIGLAKKVLLADVLLMVSSRVFDLSTIGHLNYEVSIIMAWMGLLAFSMGIYYDVSAYSDLAIGTALTLGYKVDENTIYPYMAKSITEFFERFQVSLIKWFREYFRKPFIAKKETQDRMIYSLFLMWLLIGFWHGARWTFVFWGIWISLFVMLEQMTIFEWVRNKETISRIYTIMVVIIGWVFFKSKDLFQAGEYFRNLVGLNYNRLINPETWFFIREFGLVFILGAIFLFPIAPLVNQWQLKNPSHWLVKLNLFIYPLVMIGIFIVSILYLNFADIGSFVYFFRS